jgi:hypothetical protein
MSDARNTPRSCFVHVVHVSVNERRLDKDRSPEVRLVHGRMNEPPRTKPLGHIVPRYVRDMHGAGLPHGAGPGRRADHRHDTTAVRITSRAVI